MPFALEENESLHENRPGGILSALLEFFFRDEKRFVKAVEQSARVEYAQIWYESCLRNCRVNKTTLHINEPGRHCVRILCGDAGTVLQKIVLDFGGLKRSYLGPEPTRAE